MKRSRAQDPAAAAAAAAVGATRAPKKPKQQKTILGAGLHQLTPKSWIEVFEHVLDNADADLAELRKDMWKEDRPTYLMWGRPAVSRRTQRFFATHPKIKYNFTGAPGATHTVIAGMVQKCLDFSKMKYPEFDFNGALVNLYKDFTDYIGWHADDERDLIPGAPILSFSFGSSRDFNIRRKTEKGGDDEDPITVKTLDNFLIVMGGDMQKEFEHCVPKSARMGGWRINVTVRSFKIPA